MDRKIRRMFDSLIPRDQQVVALFIRVLVEKDQQNRELVKRVHEFLNENREAEKEKG